MSDPASASAAFRYPSFRWFTSARGLSILASEALSVAVAWHIYARTGRAIDLGYVGLVQFVPAVGLALVTGYTADRFDRRRVALLCQAVLCLCALLLWVFARDDRGSVLPLYGVLFLMGTARAFRDPAIQSLLPDLVPLAHFNNAVSWNASIAQAARVLGPALGGALYAGLHASGVFAVSALLFAAGLLLLAAISAPARTPPSEPFRIGAFFAGLRYVWREKILLGAISLDLFAVLLGGQVALLPIFARDLLHTGPVGLGLLRSAPAVGAGLTAVLLAHRPLSRRAGTRMLGAVGLFGLATIGFGLSRSFTLSLLLLVVLGAADMVSVNVRLTLEQLRTPPSMRGRVSAVNMLFINASNQLGELESGLTAAWLGAVPAVIAGGIGTCLVAALWARLFPDLRNLERVDRPPAPIEATPTPGAPG